MEVEGLKENSTVSIHSKDRQKERQAIAEEIIGIYKSHSLSLREIKFVDELVREKLMFNLHM